MLLDDLQHLAHFVSLGFCFLVLLGIAGVFVWLFATHEPFRRAVFILSLFVPTVVGFLFLLGWTGDWFITNVLEPHINDHSL